MSKKNSPMIKSESYSQFYIELIMPRALHYEFYRIRILQTLMIV